MPQKVLIESRLRIGFFQVRLIPARFVKPPVTSNKNDFVDAEAIAEAVERKNMRHGTQDQAVTCATILKNHFSRHAPLAYNSSASSPERRFDDLYQSPCPTV